MNEKHYDTIIVGGGISGLTSGIYSARAGQKTLIIQGGYNSNTDMPGGQLLLTNLIENFPGYEGSGSDLIDKVIEQAEKAGCEMVEENATKFSFSNDNTPHTVTTDEDDEYTASSVVLATGAIARRLGITGEDEFFSRGVSTCATCDGAFYENQNVVVVGGGDTAVEDALYLAGIANKVIVIHRRNEFRTDSPESRQLMESKNVEIRWNTVVESLAGDTKLSSARLRNTEDSSSKVEPIDGLFVAVGHDPATKHFHGTTVELIDGNYLKVENTFTNIPGVFGAGDVADSVYRQAVTAASTGAQAAMNAIKYNKAHN